MRVSSKPRLARPARVGRRVALVLSCCVIALIAVRYGRARGACSTRIPPVVARALPLASAAAPDAVSGTMIRIAAGSFRMGNANGDEDETPVRSVELASFEIDRTEVTVRAYDACVSSGPCRAPGSDPYCNWPKRAARGSHPINCVSWEDATAFCRWAGKRLPSESEWEFAARGPEARRYPWGNAKPAGQLCWDGPGSDVEPGARKGTCAVASYAMGRSPFGVEDMAGNVLEWTSDLYSVNYETDPSTTQRVNRGGSWITYEGSDTRASLRFRMAPTRRDFTVGFRCVR
jgi:formylglycine-generating enzyme